MTTISVTLPSDGTTADVADVNTPITTIVNVINGGLDNANIAASAGIDGTKLADGAITSAKVATGMPVQIVSAVFTSVATGTTLIPVDNTIPQITEGDEYMTITITPKSATNILVFSVNAFLSSSIANSLVVSLFQTATANSIATIATYQSVGGSFMSVPLTHTMAAGTTSATTFRVRCGQQVAGTMTFNGVGGGSLFGAITKSSVVITEYKA
jgi:hypothetical protein